MEKAINIQTKESHFKNPIHKKQPPRTLKQQSAGGKCFNNPPCFKIYQKMQSDSLLQFIEFFSVFLRRRGLLLQCFQWPAGWQVLPGKAKGRQLTRAFTAGKLPAPKKRHWKAGLWPHNSSFSRSSSSTSLRSMSSSTGSSPSLPSQGSLAVMAGKEQIGRAHV